MKQLSVLLVFGGESTEHDVSLKSAKNVWTAFDKQKYDLKLCYIDKAGKWWLYKEWPVSPDNERVTQLVVVPGSKAVLTVPGGELVNIDVIFPVLHGKMGEDGTVQGLAAMAHIPIVGCDVEASAICMNKDATKRLVEAEGIPVVPWLSVQVGESTSSIVRRTKLLNKHGPWFVKPSRAGSSVGVSKVDTIEALGDAVSKALEHDDSALVEVAINGRELEVAVLGNVPTHRASGIGEIIPGSEFYDYDEKYSSESMSKTVLDANLPKALSKVIRQHALDSYRATGCAGLARIDFLLSDDLIPYMNEINTLPGFTDISMYPKLWQDKGLEQTELIDTLISLSLE